MTSPYMSDVINLFCKDCYSHRWACGFKNIYNELCWAVSELFLIIPLWHLFSELRECYTNFDWLCSINWKRMASFHWSKKHQLCVKTFDGLGNRNDHRVDQNSSIRPSVVRGLEVLVFLCNRSPLGEKTWSSGEETISEHGRPSFLLFPDRITLCRQGNVHFLTTKGKGGLALCHWNNAFLGELFAQYFWNDAAIHRKIIIKKKKI